MAATPQGDSPGAGPRRAALLSLRGITKSFPGVTALDNVSFELLPGEVHVLFGENGAGKSTLINIVAGTFAPDAGTIEIKGEVVRHQTPHDARNKGVGAVFQDLSLVPPMTVEENLFLGREQVVSGFLHKRSMLRATRQILQGFGFDIDPGAQVVSLTRAQQQMVEIAKALQGRPQILILDEPTSALTDEEAETTFKLVDRLKRGGVGVIYITHRMREIGRVGDRITVLRDGRHVVTLNVKDVTENRLVELMTGRSFAALYPKVERRPGKVILELDNVAFSSAAPRGLNLQVREGEIVGIAGLVGSGKSRVARACYGLVPIASGRLLVGGRPVRRPGPRALLARGLSYQPADRRLEALALVRPIRENVPMAALEKRDFSRFGFLRRSHERTLVRGLVERLEIRPPDIERPVAFLSGGNQQKVVLSRGLTRAVHVYVAEEPTAGIDVGAKAEIYGLMKDLCQQGAGILLVSSDLVELLNMAHRLYVMHRNQIRAELEGDSMTEEAVLSKFFDLPESEGTPA